MILDFSVSNYRSISEEQSLNMTAAKFVSKKKEVDLLNTIVIDDKLTLLKSKAIYGANASGKSNMIKAMLTFIRLVDGSVKDASSLKVLVDPFLLSSEYDKKPTTFQLIFLLDGTKYRYGFEVTTEKVISEWLFGTPGKKEVKYFTRSVTEMEISHINFPEGEKIKELVKETALFLSTIYQFKGEKSNRIINYITSFLIIDDGSTQKLNILATKYLEQFQGAQRMIGMMKVADIGIERLEKVEYLHGTIVPSVISDSFDALPGSFLASIHKRYEASLNKMVDLHFDFELRESAGSQRMFQLSALILSAMEQGRVLIIDEFDAKFHPILTKKLVELFNSELNKNNAQFIFATHDTNLLGPDLLRKDQVCFVEKNQQGASNFYSLAEFKGVRNDASIEKDYISGRFGAIPFLGDFNSIFEEAGKKPEAKTKDVK